MLFVSFKPDGQLLLAVLVQVDLHIGPRSAVRVFLLETLGVFLYGQIAAVGVALKAAFTVDDLHLPEGFFCLRWSCLLGRRLPGLFFQRPEKAADHQHGHCRGRREFQHQAPFSTGTAGANSVGLGLQDVILREIAQELGKFRLFQSSPSFFKWFCSFFRVLWSIERTFPEEKPKFAAISSALSKYQ